jgi:hypothetical protein
MFLAMLLALHFGVSLMYAQVLYPELPKQISLVLLWYSWSSLQHTNTTFYGSTLVAFPCISSQHGLTGKQQGTEDKM